MLTHLIKRVNTRIREMAKNARKRGKSARNGNRPAPYTKYGKSPYIYSQAYRDWKRAVLNNRSPNSSSKKAREWKVEDRNEFRMAAE